MKAKIFQAKDFPKMKKHYVLDMFPYPSAEGLHVGHPEGYTASDIFARYLKMNGFEVLHPMGWDAFGLPAENYAIRTGTQPEATTQKNIKNFKRQIQSLGFAYDWSREINTTDPEYYKWTQWIFLKLFEAGLAYEAFAPINWCPKDKTGLANEEVVNGKCERCGTEVVKKNIRQWLVKITDRKYIDRLLSGLEKLDWPESIKSLQKNWIGKSEGATVSFSVIARSEATTCPPNSLWRGRREQSRINNEIATPLGKLGARNDTIEVFTTRPDTLFGATYLVLSPEHPLVDEITAPMQKKAVEDYKLQASKKSDLDRTDLAKEKTGVFTGAYAINPVNNKKIPIWIADYVLASYGTGAIMAVPAHDERDFEFAKKYKLPIVKVIEPPKVMPKRTLESFASSGAAGHLQGDIESDCWIGGGVMVNSGKYDGMDSLKFSKVITDWLEKNDKGHQAVQYKLRDWVFSRQRYWGEPIPIIHCEKCKTDVELNAYEIHFYNQESWDMIMSGEKTVETRALNPDEKLKYFGNIKKGNFLRAVNKQTKQVQFLEVLEAKAFASLEELFKRPILIKQIYPKISIKTLKDLKQAFSFTPEYVDRIQRHGLIAWKIKKIQPGLIAVPEKDLPLELPRVKAYQPTGTGESPLASIEKWVKTKCPKCGSKARRETNTMPQWAGSNWYFIRYCDPNNEKQIASPEKLKAWLPVDLYVGGAEHAVLHLLYARFIYKFLFDLGSVPKECGDEPFMKLKNQGLILAQDNQKMSKSRGNVVNPDEVIKEFGADAMRMYEMFMGPFEDAKPWSINGIVGVKRFLDRVWVDVNALHDDVEKQSLTVRNGFSKSIHGLIKKVTQDIKNFGFNTCISEFMIFFNGKDGKPDWRPKLNKQDEWEAVSEIGKAIDMDALKTFLKLLSPFAPHIAEELWRLLGNKGFIAIEAWPKYDELKTQAKEIEMPIQINGKVRDRIIVPADTSETEIKAMVLGREKVKNWLQGKEPKNFRYIKGKIVSLVI